MAAANAEYEAILAENDSLRAEKKALQGAVKGVTVEQVKELKSVAMRGAAGKGTKGGKSTASEPAADCERKAGGS